MAFSLDYAFSDVTHETEQRLAETLLFAHNSIQWDQSGRFSSPPSDLDSSTRWVPIHRPPRSLRQNVWHH
jgi:hypothetical protein